MGGKGLIDELLMVNTLMAKVVQGSVKYEVVMAKQNRIRSFATVLLDKTSILLKENRV
ncbi:MAG: hypothetical protein IJC66_04650 [Kiritimatiellae bacterium]|nr:hypothetical protein [Kiritimatiellia bacterium]